MQSFKHPITQPIAIFWVVLLVFQVGCGNGIGQVDSSSDPSLKSSALNFSSGNGEPIAGMLDVQLLYDGGLFSEQLTKDVYLSAPIFPLTALYKGNEGKKNFPTEGPELAQFAERAHISYLQVLETCSELPDYGDRITLLSPGGAGLSPDVIARNYVAVAECLSQKIKTKSEYMPEIINQVDICSLHMGPNYRMLHESDLESIPDQFYTQARSILAKVEALSNPDTKKEKNGLFYFSMASFIRGADGALKVANLYPDASQRILPLPKKVDLLKRLKGQVVDVGNGATKEVAITLRCINDPK